MWYRSPSIFSEPWAQWMRFLRSNIRDDHHLRKHILAELKKDELVIVFLFFMHSNRTAFSKQNIDSVMMIWLFFGCPEANIWTHSKLDAVETRYLTSQQFRTTAFMRKDIDYLNFLWFRCRKSCEDTSSPFSWYFIVPFVQKTSGMVSVESSMAMIDIWTYITTLLTYISSLLTEIQVMYHRKYWYINADIQQKPCLEHIFESPDAILLIKPSLLSNKSSHWKE